MNKRDILTIGISLDEIENRVKTIERTLATITNEIRWIREVLAKEEDK